MSCVGETYKKTDGKNKKNPYTQMFGMALNAAVGLIMLKLYTTLTRKRPGYQGPFPSLETMQKEVVRSVPSVSVLAIACLCAMLIMQSMCLCLCLYICIPDSTCFSPLCLSLQEDNTEEWCHQAAYCSWAVEDPTRK